MFAEERQEKIFQIVTQRNSVKVSELSDELDISRSALQAILLCKANPRMDTIEHIASRLGVSPISLLSSQEEMKHSLQHFQKITDQMIETIKSILSEEDE